MKLTVVVSCIALGAAATCAPWAAAQALPGAAEPAATAAAPFTARFAGKTLAATDTLSLVFASPGAMGEGQFAVLVGNEDLSAQFRWVSPTHLEGVFAALPLPTGAHALRVFKVAPDNQWVEVGQVPIQVDGPVDAAQGEGQAAVIRPSLIVGMKSQLAQTHSALAAPPARPTYADLTQQGALQAELGGADWSLKSQLNAVGSSYRPEAVDYAAQGDTAPKLDLANYLVEASLTHGAGVTGVALGQVQAGNNPLIANGIGHRGVLLTHRFNERVDLAAALQNSAAIAGADNLTGLQDGEQRLATFTVGAEMLERAGGLRLEATSFRGIIKPRLTSGVATLQDAEESRGWGWRARMQNEAASLRADLAYARSTYTPSGDSALGIAPGPGLAGSTWYAELAYDLLRSAPFIKDHPLTLTAQARHEYAARGYKSLGAGQGADYASDMLGLSGALGLVSGQLQWSRRSDNVDGAAAFLRNRAQTLNLTLQAPLAQMLDSASPPAWAPTASYSHARNRSFADTGHLPAGQTLADLPDVLASTHGLGLNWVLGKVSLGYQYSRNRQDNRQPGFERQDVQDSGHSLNASWQASEFLALTGGAGRRVSVQQDTGLRQRSHTAQAGIHWLFGARYTFNASLGGARDRDSAGTTDSRHVQAQLQLLKQFDVTGFGRRMPAQWSLGYTHSVALSPGIVVRYQTLNLALSLSFF